MNRTPAGGGAGNKGGPALQGGHDSPVLGGKRSEGRQPAVTQAGCVTLAPASFPVIIPIVITIAAATGYLASTFTHHTPTPGMPPVAVETEAWRS